MLLVRFKASSASELIISLMIACNPFAIPCACSLSLSLWNFNSQPISFFHFTQIFPARHVLISSCNFQFFLSSIFPFLRIGALNFLLIMLQDSANTLGTSDTKRASSARSVSRLWPGSDLPDLPDWLDLAWLNKLQLFASQLCTHAHSLAQFSFVSLDFVIAFGFAHCI